MFFRVIKIIMQQTAAMMILAMMKIWKYRHLLEEK